jgi:hypothetical protein
MSKFKREVCLNVLQVGICYGTWRGVRPLRIVIWKRRSRFLISIARVLLFKNHKIIEKKEIQMLSLVNKIKCHSCSQQRFRDHKNWIYGTIEK